jgi:hypothetical protein
MSKEKQKLLNFTSIFGPLSNDMMSALLSLKPPDIPSPKYKPPQLVVQSNSYNLT